MTKRATKKEAERRKRYPRFETLLDKLPAERRARIEDRAAQIVMEANLRELRKMRGLTQVELSMLAKIAQPELSSMERRKDHMVSTLRRIVEAMGGELEIYAKFKDEKKKETQVKLTGV